MEDVTRVPWGMPLPDRGRHRHPTAGACLMEYVSVLGGERFGVRPRCTHPALAALARHVDDAVGERTRTRLVMLAPALVGTGRRDAAVHAATMTACAAAGLELDPADAVLARAVSVGTRRLGALTGARLDVARVLDRALHTGAVPWRRLLGVATAPVRARVAAPWPTVSLRAVLRRLDALLAPLDPADREARLVALLTEVLDEELAATGRLLDRGPR